MSHQFRYKQLKLDGIRRELAPNYKPKFCRESKGFWFIFALLVGNLIELNIFKLLGVKHAVLRICKSKIGIVFKFKLFKTTQRLQDLINKLRIHRTGFLKIVAGVL